MPQAICSGLLFGFVGKLFSSKVQLPENLVFGVVGDFTGAVGDRLHDEG